jgi:hypothetical protein
VAPGPRPRLAAAPGSHLSESERQVRFKGEWIQTPILHGEPPAGREAEGPVVF